MMDKELQDLHDLYSKHQPAGKLYTIPRDSGSGIARCACGRWFYYWSGYDVWEPLFGPCIVDYIDEHPELYEPMHEYITGPRPPGCQEWPTWDDIAASVSPAVKAMHKPTTVSKVPQSGQRLPLPIDPMTGPFLPSVPSPISPYQTMQDNTWRIWSTSTTDTSGKA